MFNTTSSNVGIPSADMDLSLTGPGVTIQVNDLETYELNTALGLPGHFNPSPFAERGSHLRTPGLSLFYLATLK